MGKLDTNKKVKEDSLLNTAFSLFTTKGVSKTSISDIVNNAGVAKGTFYLYFKDKYDIRNKLVSHKSSQLFRNAIEALNASGKKLTFNERIIFIVDNIINQLNENKSLLTFIAKNLSWGVFKHALTSPIKDDDIDFRNIYDAMLADAPYDIVQPEVMIFMIVELVSSTCYSSILYNEPVDIGELKPYLYICINSCRHCKSIKKTRLQDRKRVFFLYKKTDGRYPSVWCFYYFALTASLAFATILSAHRPYSLSRSTAGPE